MYQLVYFVFFKQLNSFCLKKLISNVEKQLLPLFPPP